MITLHILRSSALHSQNLTHACSLCFSTVTVESVVQCIVTLALAKSPDRKGHSERTARPTVSMARWKKLATCGQKSDTVIRVTKQLLLLTMSPVHCEHFVMSTARGGQFKAAPACESRTMNLTLHENTLETPTSSSIPNDTSTK